VRNGLSVPPAIRLNNVLNMATKVSWGLSMLATRHRSFGNLAGHVKGTEGVGALAKWTSTQFDAALSWKDVEWVKSVWGGKLIIKGVMDLGDARSAVAAGADAVVVSNHGGRQLDGAPSSISVLPKIADAIGPEIELMFDGGIRTGADMMRALALGAKSCLIGRAFAWALGAGGEKGVSQAISFLQKELDITMALTGVNRISEIDRKVLAA
jgi:L-lactate dehydrogenase (cytochrome)